MDSTQPTLPADAAPGGGVGVAIDQAKAFLVAQLGREVSGVAPIGQGEWSKAYTFRHGDAEYVIRFSGFSDDFAKDRLAAQYASRDLPIPAVTEIGEAAGGFYAISERVPGEYLDELDGPEMRAMLPTLFGMLDAARQVDLSSSTGYGAWGGNGTAPYASWPEALLDVAADRPSDRTYGWRERLAASPTGTQPFDEALEQLRGLVTFCPKARHLIHSDLLNYNVLVADGHISGVIDWGCSMYGDFLYDLAWFAFWAPWYPAWQGIDFQREALRHYESLGLEVPYFTERLRCYQLHIGLAGQAYSAYKGRWADLEATARRTFQVGAAT